MADVNFNNIELVNRKEELKKLKEYLVKVIEGKGLTVFISGEAGIGKTRMVEELITQASDLGFKVIRGQCLPEHIEPFFPFKSALKRANLEYLLSTKAPPRVVSAYLISGSGLLIAKAEREESNLDPDIFVGMLKAIEAFLKDSMQILGEEKNATLNSLSYGNYNIIIRTLKGISLATVIKGEPSEFLIEDMRITLENLSDYYLNWDGSMENTELAREKLEWFIKSGKYDGTYPAEEPHVIRENMFDNILLGLQRLSEKKPVILFIDDLQWADRTSLNFIYYLSRNTRNNRILIIGTYRPEEIIPADGKMHPLEETINNLAAENLLTIIGLKRLSRDDTFIFISRILGDFEPSLGDKIYEESNGNPLFIIEIIKLMLYENAIYNDGKRWKLRKKAMRMAIPKHAYELIKRRLERLDDEEREILDVASVIGEEFDVPVLSLVTGMDELKILKNLNKIYRKHKLIYAINGKYRFEHSIIREVLYNELLDELRRKYHRLIGDVIYELNRDNIGQVRHLLAHHYYEARDKKAVKYLIEMGIQARKNYATDEALNYFKRALEIDGDNNSKILALENIGDILSDSGDFEGGERNYREALKLASEPQSVARLHRKLATLYEKRGEFTKSKSLIERALSLLKEPSIEVARLYQEMGNIKFLQGKYGEALEDFKKALKLFSQMNSLSDIGCVLEDVASVYFILGEMDRAKKYYTKALEIMKESGNIKDVAMILSNMGDMYLMRGKIEKALKIYESSLNTLKNVRYKWGVTSLLNKIGDAHLLQGNVDEAFIYYRDALTLAEQIGQKTGIVESLLNIGRVLFLKGDVEHALKILRRALKITQDINDDNSSARILLVMAKIYALMGKTDYAVKIINRSVDTLEKLGSRHYMVDALIISAQILLEKRMIENAMEEIKRAIDLSKNPGYVDDEYRARIVLGAIYREMGNYRDAIIELTKSLKYFKQRNDVKVAGIYCEFARLWMKRGDLKMANNYIEKAQKIYQARGMKVWDDKCGKSILFH